jgi:NTP pyrophosphatase (non-canonical NTP hydrolase)
MYIKVHLPDDIEHYEPELRKFFELMVQKLYVNRFKGWGENVTLELCHRLLIEEVEELAKAIKTEGQFQSLIECADIANISVITALKLTRITREDFETERKSVQ